MYIQLISKYHNFGFRKKKLDGILVSYEIKCILAIFSLLQSLIITLVGAKACQYINKFCFLIFFSIS